MKKVLLLSIILQHAVKLTGHNFYQLPVDFDVAFRYSLKVSVFLPDNKKKKHLVYKKHL